MTTSLPSPPTPSATPTNAPSTIGFDDLGTGAPVVLLHPSGFGPDVLAPFATAIAAHHRVVIPHRRGFGASAGLALPSSLDDHHDDLAALIDRLHLRRPLVAGVSAGATLAFDFARRDPGRVGAAVAHEPLVGPLGGPLHARIVGRVGRLLERADHPHETSLFISELVGVGTWNSLRQDWRINVERYGAATRHEAALFAELALDEADLRALAGRDVLATVGERSAAPRHDLAATLARRGVATRTIPRAGHLPVVEAPEEFAAVLDDALPAAA
jgi:pimeloyl-ACP methyl ester carboxylesterase